MPRIRLETTGLAMAEAGCLNRRLTCDAPDRLFLDQIYSEIDPEAGVWSLRTQLGTEDLVSLYTCRCIEYAVETRGNLFTDDMRHFAYKMLLEIERFLKNKCTRWSVIRKVRKDMTMLTAGIKYGTDNARIKSLIKYLLNSLPSSLNERVDTAGHCLQRILAMAETAAPLRHFATPTEARRPLAGLHEMVHKEFLSLCLGQGDYGLMLGRPVKEKTDNHKLNRSSSLLRINGLERRAILIEKKQARAANRKLKKAAIEIARRDAASSGRADSNPDRQYIDGSLGKNNRSDVPVLDINSQELDNQLLKEKD